MAITKKRPAIPSVSDRSVEDLENYIMGYESVGGGINYGSEAINDPYLSQEVVNILSDPNTDHGYFLAQAMECYSDAARFGQAADTAINQRKTLVALCNAFGRASAAQGYEDLTAKSYWYSLEASGFADDAKDFGKRVWEAIKAAIKKLILMVINLVKSIGNFIKGAAAKAQEFFWKKYARMILQESRTVKKDVKMKIKSQSATKVWKTRPDDLLKRQCAILTGALSGAQSVISGKMIATAYKKQKEEEYTERQYNQITRGKNKGKYNAQNVTKTRMVNDEKSAYMSSANTSSLNYKSSGDDFSKEINSCLKGFSEAELGYNIKKMKDQAGKWFPSAASVVNLAVYGNEKPSKNDVPVSAIVAQGNSLLEPGTLQAMSYCFKTANTANKALQSTLNSIDKIGKATYGFSDREDRPSAKKQVRNDILEPVQKIRRMLQFFTTLLIQLYGTCLSARMTVYAAARKMVRKGEKGKNNDNDSEAKADKAASA